MLAGAGHEVQVDPVLVGEVPHDGRHRWPGVGGGADTLGGSGGAAGSGGRSGVPLVPVSRASGVPTATVVPGSTSSSSTTPSLKTSTSIAALAVSTTATI